jgi:hypothetical protein
MKKRIVLAVFILMVAMLLVYAVEKKVEKKDEKKLPENEVIREVFGCIASAPGSAMVGQVVRFQSYAAPGNAGAVAATDNIVGVMRYVPASIPGRKNSLAPKTKKREDRKKKEAGKPFHERRQLRSFLDSRNSSKW